jgi:lipopolysaccharide transport system permease protein
MYRVEDTTSVSPGHFTTPMVLRPPTTWPRLGLDEIWSYRELFWFLVWRDLKVRYRQTFLGVMWVVLQPMLTMAVFAVVLGRLVGVPSDGLPYPLFAYAGLLPWLFFSSAVTTGAATLVGNANLISKVYFPRILLPAAAATARLVDFGVGSLGLVALLLLYRVPLTPGLVVIPVAVGLELMLAVGVAAYLSSLNVKFRDIGFVVPLLLQLGMFATPVLYHWTLVPARWRWVIVANPLTGIIESYRSALLGRALPWQALLVSLAAALVVLAVGVFEIRRMEGTFADIV